jgi:hypothetical protein
VPERKVYVYRLTVEYPPGSLRHGWEPDDWDPWPDGTAGGYDADGAPLGAKFCWPVNRLCFTRSTAKRRAGLFEKYGAQVTIERSDPVTWPEAARTVTPGQVSG